MLAKGWVRMHATVGLVLGVFLFAYGCSGDTTAKKMAFGQRGDAYFADGKYAEAILERTSDSLRKNGHAIGL
jgi:hypothetical protein